MDFSKLSNALGNQVRKDTTDVVLSDSFTVSVAQLAAHNQHYRKAVQEFVAKHPKHPMADPNLALGFTDKVYRSEYSDDAAVFVAHVLVTGWKLTDDDGKSEKYTVAKMVEVLRKPNIGPVIFANLVSTAITASQYRGDYSEAIAGN